MAIVIVATAMPVPEFRGEVIAAFEAAEEIVHASEDGCLLYAPARGAGRQAGDDREVRRPGGRDAHLKGDGLAALSVAIKGKLAAPMDVQMLAPHTAGRPTRRALTKFQPGSHRIRNSSKGQ